MTFEDSLKELENINKIFEKGDCTLDESIALYEKAIKLAKECSSSLERAKLKIKDLEEIEADTVE